MSATVPQVLSRKANGTSNGTAGQGFDQAGVRHRGKSGGENSHASKSGKGRGTADKRSAVKSTNEGDAPKAKPSRSKAHNEGEKLVIRRLPPGMTQQECVSILGSDWEVSKGRVDWFSYVPGKISTDPSKPSRPSRAYIHLMRKDDIMPLSEVVRNSTWEDAKSTFTNPALIGPPVLEFSIYKKVAGTKRRTDARQGTIDQDPEFMAFLEALANPAPVRESIDVEDLGESKTDSKATTTPLVEFLKEKKANKGKDGSGKNSRSSGKGKGGSKDDDTSTKKKGKDSKGDKADKADKPAKETVKILTKKAATEQAVEAAKKAGGQMTATTPTANATTGSGVGSNAGAAADAPKSRRAGIAAAARILQRDLGLSPGSAHRRARHDVAKAEADAKEATAVTKEKDTPAIDSPATATMEKAPPQPDAAAAQTSKGRPESPAATKSQTGRRNRGAKNADKTKGAAAAESAAIPVQRSATNPPVILKKKTDTEVPSKTAENPSSSQARSSIAASNNKPIAKEKGNNKQSQKKSPLVSANARRAFVKHVNASQGVNDASLRETLGAFGTVTLVEIDKRKGFAYVDFSGHDGLVKAVTASPISIGQASIQVLERKDKKPAPATATAASAASSAPAKEGSVANSDKEKPSGGRGRRGRGGRGGGGAANGENTTSPATANKEAPASAGG